MPFLKKLLVMIFMWLLLIILVMTFHLNCSVRIDDRLHYQLVVSNAKRVTGVKVELLNEKPESKEFGIRCSCDKAGRCYLSTGEIFAGLHIWLSMLHLRNALRDNQLEVVVGTYATTLSDVSATATAVVPSKLCDDILSVKRNIIVPVPPPKTVRTQLRVIFIKIHT